MTSEIRPKGKSRMNEMVREQFATMGMKPCPRCAVPGKWDIFHPPDKPCPIGVEESGEIAQEVWDSIGHDPDLDENGICRVCGKYEPE